MLKVVLVDDEKAILNELEYLLKQYNNVEIVGMFTDPIEAMENIEVLEPNAVLLDIDMPVLNGLNMARELTYLNKNIAIVFITAFNYAVEAFEINAIDYLLKPVRKDRLNLALEKLKTTIEGRLLRKEHMSPLTAFLENNNSIGPNKLVVYDGEEYHVINADDVFYIEAQKKDTIIVTAGSTYKTRKSLDIWENRLKRQGFFRCHRSFLVNLKHIIKVSPLFNNHYVIKQQGSAASIPVSRNRMVDLKKLLE